MMINSLPDAARAESLTQTLRRAGVLGGARICDVVLGRSIAKQRSLTLQLLLTYDETTSEAPRSLVLKMGHSDKDGRPSYRNERETEFYRRILPILREDRVPRCFEVVEATDTNSWHLLLEDLTDSHSIATEYPIPPTLVQCKCIVTALARLHAAMWDDRRFDVSVGRRPDAEWDIHLRGFAARFERFVNAFGQLISPARRDLYERLLDRAPRLLSRYRTKRNLTLIHGDAHPWNFFLPRRYDSDDVRLFDWESWSVDIGTTDLAYMMAMLWYPDLRVRFEGPLQDIYHAELSAQGVGGYDRHALADDYRLSVLLLILRPIRQAELKIPPRVWWPNLERIMLAVDDLGCRDLLG